MKISLIAALDENRVIGFNERLPWGSLPKDWENLFLVTAGKRMIMGRKSYDSEDRIWSKVGNFVITRQKNLKLEEGFIAVNSLIEALGFIKPGEEVFVLGGGQIFEEAIKIADVLHITIVHAKFEGDTFFPEIDLNKFRLISDVKHYKDETHNFDFSFLIFEKAYKKGDKLPFY